VSLLPFVVVVPAEEFDKYWLGLFTKFITTSETNLANSSNVFGSLLVSMIDNFELENPVVSYSKLLIFVAFCSVLGN